MSQPKVRSTTQRFLSNTKPKGVFWSQHHLHNPTAKVHHPLHKRLTIKAAIHPDGCQTRYLLARLFDPFFTPGGDFITSSDRLNQ
jgi:hypothetical protein